MAGDRLRRQPLSKEMVDVGSDLPSGHGREGDPEPQPKLRYPVQVILDRTGREVLSLEGPPVPALNSSHRSLLSRS